MAEVAGNPFVVEGDSRTSRLGLAVMVAVWCAILVRTLGLAEPAERAVYISGLAAFLAVCLLVLVRPPRSAALLHVAFVAQAAIVLVLLALEPSRDFLTGLYVLQCYQAAVVFAAWPRLIWVASLVALIGLSLVLELGPLRGLALALIPMAAGIVLSTYVVVSREREAARAASERLVGDLRAAQQQLTVYAARVDELTAVEERSRLAGELQASVSTTLAEVLSAVAVVRQALDDTERAAGELQRLQALTQEALAQMRRIIAELRPPQT